MIWTGASMGTVCDGCAFVGDCCVDDEAEEPARLGDEIGAFISAVGKKTRKECGVRCVMFTSWTTTDRQSV